MNLLIFTYFNIFITEKLYSIVILKLRILKKLIDSTYIRIIILPKVNLLLNYTHLI